MQWSPSDYLLHPWTSLPIAGQYLWIHERPQTAEGVGIEVSIPSPPKDWGVAVNGWLSHLTSWVGFPQDSLLSTPRGVGFMVPLASPAQTNDLFSTFCL